MLKDLVKKCEVGQWSGSMRVALDDMVKSFNDAMTQAMECCVPLVPEKAIAEERCLEAAPGRERRRARKMLHKWNRKITRRFVGSAVRGFGGQHVLVRHRKSGRFQ
mmetsp:Transcript_11313/g.22755  ORF Transcript_11313/g.22755 Transcript_11313/m.22755 type:complete len:106 (-) Transcript_11313:2550-2867(-)